MKTFTKYLVLLAISTSLLAMDDEMDLTCKFVSSWNDLDDTTSSRPATTSAIAGTLDVEAEAEDAFHKIGDSYRAESESPTLLEPIRKERRKTLPVQSASSSGASTASSAAAPTDTQTAHAAASSSSSKDDDPLYHYTVVPVHCPWPDCKATDTLFSPPRENISGLTELKHHIKTHHLLEPKPHNFFCPHISCDKSKLYNKPLKSSSELADHLLSTHNHSEIFRCTVCGEKRSFSTKRDCAEHLRDFHKRLGTWYCNCQSRTSKTFKLRNHIPICQKLKTRMEMNRCFWCPCGDACTKIEAPEHMRLCLRARMGMVHVKQEKDNVSISNHKTCMELLHKLEIK